MSSGDELVRAVSNKQATAMFELFQTLTKLEEVFHDTELGPRQLNIKPGAPGIASIKDFTIIRHNLDGACHASMDYDKAWTGLKGVKGRHQELVLEEDRKKDPAVNRWANTRDRISKTLGKDGKAKIAELNKLLQLLAHQLATALEATQRDADYRLPRANLMRLHVTERTKDNKGIPPYTRWATS